MVWLERVDRLLSIVFHMASDHVSGHVMTPYQGTADKTAKETLTRYKRATLKNVQVLLCFANSKTALWTTKYLNNIVWENIPVVFCNRFPNTTKWSSSFTYEPDVVDGNWSPWVSWTTCSVTCGVGIMTRDRFCDNPEPQHGGLYCDGFAQETEGCQRGHCAGGQTLQKHVWEQ